MLLDGYHALSAFRLPYIVLPSSVTAVVIPVCLTTLQFSHVYIWRYALLAVHARKEEEEELHADAKPDSDNALIFPQMVLHETWESNA